MCLAQAGHRTNVRTLSYSTDNTTILSASSEEVKLWNRYDHFHFKDGVRKWETVVELVTKSGLTQYMVRKFANFRTYLYLVVIGVVHLFGLLCALNSNLVLVSINTDC